VAHVTLRRQPDRHFRSRPDLPGCEDLSVPCQWSLPMPAARACQLVLAAGDRHRLKRLERSHTPPWRQVLRAKIVLLAARPMPNARIAARLGVTVDTARKWRGRFATLGMDGLADRKRPGRPPRFTAVQVAEVKALACQLPAELGVPLSRWSCPELAREAITRGITQAISASTVARWLAEDALKPWQHRSWIFVRDPDFGAKASRVLDLYACIWDGRPLGPDEYVLCADEKTSIQARCRCHPTLPPGKARSMRVNHDYDRGGALAYLAVWDVGQAKVYGRCAASTGIKPFMALVEHVMTQEPYASAKRVFWIVDNGSSHRGQAAVDRLAQRFPNAVMIHTPVHASWLNQAEIYLSVVQRKVVAPSDFIHLDQVRQRLADFQLRYNATARPFGWKFTPADLDDLLHRIDRHERQTAAPTISKAA
jgi:transposase